MVNVLPRADLAGDASASNINGSHTLSSYLNVQVNDGSFKTPSATPFGVDSTS